MLAGVRSSGSLAEMGPLRGRDQSSVNLLSSGLSPEGNRFEQAVGQNMADLLQFDYLPSSGLGHHFRSTDFPKPALPLLSWQTRSASLDQSSHPLELFRFADLAGPVSCPKENMLADPFLVKRPLWRETPSWLSAQCASWYWVISGLC